MEKNVDLLRLCVALVCGSDFGMEVSVVSHQALHVLLRGIKLCAVEQLTQVEFRCIDQLRCRRSVLRDAVHENSVHEKIFVCHENQGDLTALVLLCLDLDIVETTRSEKLL